MQIDNVETLDLANAVLVVLYAASHAVGAGTLTRLYLEEVLIPRLKVWMGNKSITIGHG